MYCDDHEGGCRLTSVVHLESLDSEAVFTDTLDGWDRLMGLAEDGGLNNVPTLEQPGDTLTVSASQGRKLSEAVRAVAIYDDEHASDLAEFASMGRFRAQVF